MVVVSSSDFPQTRLSKTGFARQTPIRFFGQSPDAPEDRFTKHTTPTAPENTYPPNMHHPSQTRYPITTAYQNSSPLLNPGLGEADFEAIVATRLDEAKTNPEAKTTLIRDLSELVDMYLQDLRQPDKTLAVTLSSLRTLLGNRGQGNLVMAQINVTPGDLEGNAKKIIRYAKLAEAIGADSVVFPELSLMGYPIFDVITRHPDIVAEQLKWLSAIARQSGKTKILLGFVEPRTGETRIGKPYFNSLAVLADGKIQSKVRKSLLPTYGEFNDYRTYEPSSISGSQPADSSGSENPNNTSNTQGTAETIHGHRYGLSICEDIWDNRSFITHPLYHRDPIAELAGQRPDALINISSSPSRHLKEPMKHNMLSHISQEHQLPTVYVNQVGGIDGISFDGASRVYDAQGQLIARAKAFEEQFMIVNPLTSAGSIYPLPAGIEETLTTQKVYDSTHESDLTRTYMSIVQGIRDYFHKSHFQKAVLGLSGGLDSAVTAVLLADALGPENVIGISMPSKITPGDNKNDAKTLASHLGIHFYEGPIVDQINVTEAFANGLKQVIGDELGGVLQGSTGEENIQAMIRAMNLRRAGNDYKLLPVVTSDKSELYMGYATVNGDMSGAYAPIGDVVKTKVRALARWMNANRLQKNAIPTSTIEKPSGADLKTDATGQTVSAETDLMPYEFLDEVIWHLEFQRDGYEDMLKEPFAYEQKMAAQGTPISPEQKAAWLDKFYRKMQSAVFKWHIMPPTTIVDGYGITSAEYRQAIVTRLAHHPQTPAEIQARLNTFLSGFEQATSQGVS